MKNFICLLFFVLPIMAFPQWTVIPSGTTNCLNSVCFPDANTGYIAGNIGTILKTVYGGMTRTALSCETTNNLNPVYFINTDIGFAVGSSGIILKTINGGTGVSNLFLQIGTLNIYQNPATNNITVEISTTPTNSQLSISNLSGQQIIIREITSPKTKLDIFSLPSGVYFVRITSEKTVVTGKFLKQ